MSTIRILVVDDQELIRRHLRRLLGSETDLNVVAEATSGNEAIRKAQEYQPNVVLLDIGIPELNGLLAAPLIKKAAPEVEILMVTSHDNSSYVREAFTAGARGYLVKRNIPAELIAAVREVFAKRRFVSEGLDFAA